MKTIKKILIIVLCFSLGSSILYGCGLKFDKKVLETGIVGVNYFQNIDDASGSKGVINYTLKEGSSLPLGLKLDSGAISGIPEEAVTGHKFSIIASDGNKQKIADFAITINTGAITYEDATTEIIINKENSGSVAHATGAVNIKYEIIDGEENVFEGLSIQQNGSISGTYVGQPKISADNEVITIKASAKDCEPATAKIKLSAVKEYLLYKGRILSDARQGVEYASTVALVENIGVDVNYNISEGSSLPEGLTLHTDGTILGIPTQVGPGTPFKVIATSPNFSDTTAEFTIDVVINHISEASSKIVNFGGNDFEDIRELKVAYDGQFYINMDITNSGSTLNNNLIVYELLTPESFPNGFTMYSNGAIFGTGNASSVGEYTFSIKASALGCEDVVRQFSLKVLKALIVFPSQRIVLTRGEATDVSIDFAVAREGIKIQYALDGQSEAELEDTWGLTVTADGKLTGIPKKSTKSMFIKVQASAEGFTSATATIYLPIREPLTETTRFEAEYTDLSGKSGTGYSGSPTEENMIAPYPGVSNGYFVSYLHNNTVTLEFVIWAEAAVSDATLYLGLGSELKDITLNPNIFGVYTYDSADITQGNKTTVNYGSISVQGAYKAYTTFQKVRLSNIALVEGYNTIQLAIHSNTLKDGVTGGPGVDYIEIETSTTLKWHPCVYNLGGRS